MGDQRSTTPYLGNGEKALDDVEGRNEDQLISTH